MNIAKLLASAAIAVAPIGIISAQSATPADSGSSGHRGEWIAGTGALAGAGLFMAFAHSSHDASSVGNSGYSFKVTGTNAAPTPNPTPNGSSTPTTPTDTTSASAPADTGSATPTDTGSVTPPDTGTVQQPTNPDPDPQDNTPTQGPANPSDDSPPATPDTSTVPEPGSLLLLGTGIVGLAPLVRRRRK